MKKCNSKLILAMIMAVLLSMAIGSPTLASADSSDYIYTLSEGKATITDYKGSDAEIFVPSSINGYPVTAIGNSAFIWCGSLERVTIADTIVSIGASAFQDCHSLTSITIPSSVTSIGQYAFMNCDSLASITIPSSVTRINQQTFTGCTSLTSISIPSSVTRIEQQAFSGCTSLGSISIPANVSYIGAKAFQGCSDLANIMLPSRITRINDYAFSGCSSLAYITVPGSVTSIGWEAFGDCASLEEIVIPANVTSIDTGAFDGCDLLTIAGYEGSYAQEYAEDNGITFRELASNPLTVVSIKADRTSVYTGTAITWTATAAGGSGDKQYRFLIYKDGVLLIDGKYSAVRTCRYTPEEPGLYRAQVYVMDDIDTKSLYSSDVQAVQAQLSLTSVKANVSSTRVDSEIIWTAVAAGGSGAKQYRFLLYKDNVLKDTSSYSLTNTFKYVPAEPGVYKVRAYVQDATGEAALNGMNVKVIAALEITKIQANKLSGRTGSAIIWTVTAKGGEGTKSYRFLVYKNNVLVKSSSFMDENTYQYTPTDAGIYRVRAYVRDSLGTVAQNSSDIPVDDSLAITGVQADTTRGMTGTAITWTASAQGGQGAKQYRFLLYKDNELITSSNYNSSNTYKYTPTATGTYRVRVYVKDSTTTVSVNSKSVPVDASLAITNIKVETSIKNSTTTITWTVTATGGKGSKQYRYLVYKNNVLVKSSSFLTTNTYKYTPTGAGNYHVRAYVRDSLGTVVQNSIDIAVDEALAITSVQADATHGKIGTAITWTASAQGGQGAKQYRFLLYKNNVLITSSNYTSSNTYKYTPTEAGSYRVRVYVKDSTATSAVNSKSIPVDTALAITSIKAEKAIKDSATTITWTVNAEGGKGSKQYRFLLYKDGSLETSRNFSSSTTYKFTTREPGVYKVRAYVKDSTGTISKTSSEITVESIISISSVTADETSVEVGEPITWTVKTVGGEGTKTYRFLLYKDDVLQSSTDFSTSKIFTYTPAKDGLYRVRAYVKDATGTAAKNSGSVEAN